MVSSTSTHGAAALYSSLNRWVASLIFQKQTTKIGEFIEIIYF